MPNVIVGKKELDKKLIKMMDRETYEKALELACIAVEGTAKVEAPVGETNRLASSITHEVVDDVGIVGTNVKYAVYVHQGTGKYAVNGDGRPGYWVFVSGSSGGSNSSGIRKIYTLEQAKWIKNYLVEEEGIPEEQVWITSGQRPNPFLSRALEMNRETIDNIFMKAIKEAVK